MNLHRRGLELMISASTISIDFRQQNLAMGYRGQSVLRNGLYSDDVICGVKRVLAVRTAFFLMYPLVLKLVRRRQHKVITIKYICQHRIVCYHQPGGQ